MSILPTWPIAAGALVIGLAGGFYFEHTRLGAKIDRMVADNAEAERQRQLVRADDERLARAQEQALSVRAGKIEQEKINEIAQVRTAADALVERVRKQAASKPARTSPVSGTAATCAPAPGGELPDRSREDFVRLAERANVLRAGLAACYGWADEVISATASPSASAQPQ